MKESESKVRIIENDLVTLIKQSKLSASGRLPSIRELGKKYNVSRSTAHMALLNLKNRGFVEIIAGKGAFAKERSTIKSKLIYNNCISFIIPNMLSYFISDIVRGVENEVAKENFYLAIFNSLNDYDVERQNIKKARELNSKAILIFPVCHVSSFCPNYDIYTETQRTGIPFLFIDNYPIHLDVDYVVNGNYKGFYNLANYLIQKGHKKIAFFGQPTYISSCRDRQKGFVDAMRKSGLRVDTDMIFPSPDEGLPPDTMTWWNMMSMEGSKYLENIIKSDKRPSAIIFTDLCTVYLDVIKNLKLRVPDDMSLCSQGSKTDPAYEPFVTLNYVIEGKSLDITHCVRQDELLGKAAAKAAVKLTQGKTAKGRVKIEIDMPLHIGNSVKKIGKPTKVLRSKTVAKL